MAINLNGNILRTDHRYLCLNSFSRSNFYTVSYDFSRVCVILSRFLTIRFFISVLTTACVYYGFTAPHARMFFISVLYGSSQFLTAACFYLTFRLFSQSTTDNSPYPGSSAEAIGKKGRRPPL